MNLAGGCTKIDTDALNDTAQQLTSDLNTAISTVEAELTTRLGKPLKVSLVKDTAESQVVAGMKYRFHVAVEDAHFNKAKVFKAVVVNKLPAHGGGFEVLELDEQPPEPGSPRLISPTNYEVEDAAAYAAQSLGQESTSLAPFQLKDVVSATQSRNADGSVTYSMRIVLGQGTMPNQVFDVVVDADENGYSLKSSDVVIETSTE